MHEVIVCRSMRQYLLTINQWLTSDVMYYKKLTKQLVNTATIPVIRGGSSPLIIDLNDEVATSSFKPVP